MSEIPTQPNPEYEREQGFAQLIEQYFAEDKAFIMEMDFEDALGFVYGQLLEEGEDPNEILKEFGVTEVNDEV